MFFLLIDIYGHIKFQVDIHLLVSIEFIFQTTQEQQQKQLWLLCIALFFNDIQRYIKF